MNRMSKGFTLIELLIVIAIICIIAAILFPVFASARDKARQSSCLSNMKQIGLAMLAYADDNDEVYPRSDTWVPGVRACPLPGEPGTAKGTYCQEINHYKWWYWLYPYTKTSQVFFCPSRMPDRNDGRDSANIDAYLVWTQSGQIYNGYVLNLSLTGALYLESGGRALPQTTLGMYRNSFSGGTIGGVRETDATMIFCEGRGYVIPTLDAPWSGVTVKSWPAAFKDYWYQVFYSLGGQNIKSVQTPSLVVNAAPHAGGLNVAYCDGHAKWLSVNQFLALCPNRTTDDGSGTYLPAAGVPNFTSANADSGLASYDSDAQSTLKKDYPFWNLYAEEPAN